jgi:hypothetical protein
MALTQSRRLDRIYLYSVTTFPEVSMPSIVITNETLERIKDLAEPFVDKQPEDVIRRLLNEHGVSTTKDGHHARKDTRTSAAAQRISRRLPRERGIILELDGRRFQAVSVRDLYQQVLAFLVDDHGPKLAAVAPFKTSNRRYLLAKEPTHPGGNHFVIPVEYRGYCLEAHKDYKNGISHLGNLVRRLGLRLRIFS